MTAWPEPFPYISNKRSDDLIANKLYDVILVSHYTHSLLVLCNLRLYQHTVYKLLMTKRMCARRGRLAVARDIAEWASVDPIRYSCTVCTPRVQYEGRVGCLCYAIQLHC